MVAVGASAGGLEALLAMLRALPADFPAAIVIAIHIAPTSTSLLPEILERSSSFCVRHGRSGELPRQARAYVAPPDRHMLVDGRSLRLSKGPRENRHRPAIDPLFRSVARAYGRRAIGVILSGNLDDGTAGLLAIKRRGGIAVVQSPEDAVYSGMPDAAIERVKVDHVVDAAAMGSLLDRIVRAPEPSSRIVVSLAPP
jgi:two-component system chemotaxis response regulator CheB